MTKSLSTLLFLSSFFFLGYLSASQSTDNQTKPDHNTPIDQINTKRKSRSRLKSVIGSVVSFLGIAFYWQREFSYPSTDISKSIRGFFLYKIEKDGQPASYLYGVSHVRSNAYVVPDLIKDLSPSIDRLVTEINISESQGFKMYKNIFFNKILEEYAKVQYPSIRFYIQEIQRYKNEDKLEFLFTSATWLSIKYNGQVKYTEEELYKVFQDQEKAGLEAAIADTKLSEMSYENFKRLVETESLKLWKSLKKYEYDDKFKKEALNEANFIDETIPINKIQSLNPLVRGIKRTRRRNKAWLPKMMRMMQEKSNLFAVGAAHINHLLLWLLSKKEYKITRISKDGTTKDITLDNFNDPFIWV